jgi:hypothetical protein
MDPGNAMGKPQNVGNTALFCNVTPVKYVGGGYYIVAMLNATDPQLLSPILPATTNVDLSKNKTIRLRFQNTTGATQGKIYFQAQSDTGFTDARSEAFAITTNDKEPHVYVLKMSSPNWTGLLKQIRFDVQSSSPLTGTIRLDYISIDDS